jgi:hypothetical protein
VCTDRAGETFGITSIAGQRDGKRAGAPASDTMAGICEPSAKGSS